MNPLPHSVPFALSPQELALRLAEFHDRQEIVWLGLEGRFEGPGTALVRFERLTPGHLGGAGTAALNGGLIATGFDAACVLAALGHVDTDVVATLTLQVQYLRRAMASPSLAFRAGATKAARHVVFVHAVLEDLARGGEPLAIAQATLAPVRTRPSPRHAQTADQLVEERSPLPG